MKLTQRSFTAGEVSPSVGARADLDWYNAALSKCKNAYVRAQGGVYNREGTKYIGESVTSGNQDVRLISFSFSKDESYILVVSNKSIQVIYRDAFLLEPGTRNRVHVVTPFEKPWDISHSGFADTMTMVDGVNLPQVLKRYGHTDWRIEPIDFSVAVSQVDSITLTGTGSSGPTRKYSYAVTAIDNDDKESLQKDASIINEFLSATKAIKVKITGGESIASFNIYKSLTPTGNIYGFIGSCNNDSESSEFYDYNYAPDVALTPPLDNEPFKDAADRPSACSFYQQRRIFAATKNDPQKIFCTETGDISSMRYSRPNKQTDAIIQEVVSNSINRIRHIINFGGLLLLTSEGEIKVTEGADFVLTPATFGAKVISSYGSSTVVPAKVSDTVIFSQDQGARLVGLNIDRQSLSIDGNVLGNDLSIRAEHIFKGKSIVDMSYCKEPYNILWCVLDDGTMSGLTYNREHKVWGFHIHDTQGKYKSIATIPKDSTSAMYMVVNRLVDGNQNHYIERLVDREDENLDDCFFVDCGVSFESDSAVKVISGIRHLYGLEVSILADGNVIKGKKVSPEGTVTLDHSAKKIQVGLPYVTELSTLSIDNPSNTMRGRDKNINSIVFDLYQTRGVKAGQDGKSLVELKPRDKDDRISIKLKTGDAKLVIKRGWNSRGKIEIRHDDPLPFGLISITPEFGVE